MGRDYQLVPCGNVALGYERGKGPYSIEVNRLARWVRKLSADVENVPKIKAADALTQLANTLNERREVMEEVLCR